MTSMAMLNNQMVCLVFMDFPTDFPSDSSGSSALGDLNGSIPTLIILLQQLIRLRPWQGKTGRAADFEKNKKKKGASIRDRNQEFR